MAGTESFVSPAVTGPGDATGKMLANAKPSDYGSRVVALLDADAFYVQAHLVEEPEWRGKVT